MNARILCLLFTTACSLSAAPDTVDSTFAGSAGQVFDPTQSGGVSSSIVQPDGKVIFGTNEMPATVGGMPIQLPLTRFNPDGSVDNTYGADNHPTGGGTGIVFFPDGWPEVHDMALQPDGKLIAAGVMQGYSADGTTITHGGMSIVRMNMDGTPDPTFATLGTIQSGGFNFINDVEVQSDGKILAAGGFSGIQNTDRTFFPRKGLVRFNSDGTVDPDFNLNTAEFGVSNFVNGFVGAVEVTAGGEIYAAISFSQGFTEVFHGLCRLRSDGSRDASFNPAYSGDFIQAIQVDSAGRILVVGRDKDATTPHVERFFSTGAKDPSFTLDPALGLVAAEQLEESPTGQYYLATDSENTAIRINGDGSLDSTFNATSEYPNNPNGDSDGFFRCFALSPDGSVYAGSFFSGVETISTKKIVKFEGEPTPGASSIRFITSEISVIESDKILTISAVRTGDLSVASSATVTITGGSAGVDDYSSTAPFVLNWPAGIGGPQSFSITLKDDIVEDGNKTINFSLGSPTGATIGTPNSSTINVIDDEAAPTFAAPPANFSTVSGTNALFTANILSPTPATFQWRLNGEDIAGAIGSTFQIPGVSIDLNGASITVVVTNAWGSTTSPVATLSVTTPDGSRDFSFPGDLAGLAAVSQFVPLPDGSIILVPAASNFGSPVRLSKILPDGTLVTNFGPGFQNLSGSSQIQNVQVAPSGKILVHGLFNSVDGVARAGLARLTATGEIDTFFSPPGKPVSAPFVDSNGRVYLSVGFSTGLLRLLDDGSIDPTFNASVARDSRGGGTIYGMTEDSLGRIYVADFVGNNPRGFPVRLQRLLSNGSADTSFAAPPLSRSTGLTVLSDGRIAFGVFNGLSILKSNGQLDTSFNVPEGTITTVNRILEDRGGFIVTGGNLLRLLANGQPDPSFPPAGGGGINDAVRVSPQSILLAATGTTFNGGVVPSVFSVFARAATLDFVPAKIVVSEDTPTFEVTVRANGDLSSPINATVVSVDDSASAGTHFTAVSEALTFDSSNLERTFSVSLTDDGSANSTREFVLRLTSPDLSYRPELQVQILDDESAPIITTQPQNLVVLPGESASISVVLKDGAGATAQWFRNGRAVNNATSLVYQPLFDGNYFAEVTRNGVTVFSDSASVKFQPDGSAIRTGFGFGSPLSQNPVKVIKTGPGGAAYVGAQSQAAGLGALSRILPDNIKDPAWSPTIFGSVHDLVVEPDGATVIVGDLDIRGDSPVVTQIARYQSDGSRDLTFQTNVGTAGGTIRVISRYPNGDLLVGGDFAEWNGTALAPGSSLVKLDANGNRIPAFTFERSGTIVSASALPDGGALVIYEQNGTTIHTVDSTGAIQSSKLLSRPLTKLVPADEGKWLVISTQNFSFGGNSGTVARLDSDLNIEQVFPILRAETAFPQPNGKVVIGGTFIKDSHRKIIRFFSDGTIDQTFSTANGVRTFNENDGKIIASLAGRTDGSIWVGGSFDGYGANNQINFPNLALINGDPVVIEFTTQPMSQFVPVGQSVTLTAAASSDLPLTYQWLLNGNPLSDDGSISGAQTAELTLPAPLTSGSYQLVVSGGPANIKSSIAFVGVLGAPMVRRITENLTTASGLPILLQVEAFGAGTLSYQWSKNGSPLVGKTSPLLNIAESKTHDSGSYTVTITNAFGSLTSDPVEVTVLQNGASVVDGFVGPSVVGVVNDLLVLPDDKVLVGGDFSRFNSADFSVQGGRYLAMMKTDGTVIPGPGPVPNNRVQALALQPDGKILVGGTFSEIGGMVRKQIARLNPDLTLDESFDPSDALPGFATIYNLVLDPDGKILICHSDRNSNYLLRLLPNGSVDPTFAVSPSNLVRDIIPQPDGTYLVAGFFSNWDGVNPNTDTGLVKIANDGSLVMPDFATSETRVSDLFQLANGDLLATYQNLSIEILGNDGQPISDRFEGLTANSSINDLIESPEGLVYFGGGFTEISGQPSNRLIRTSSIGTPDPSFNVGTGFNEQVAALALNDDGSLWVAGRFTQYNGKPASYITLLTGTLEPPATRSFEDFITATGLAPQDQGFSLDPDQDGYSNGIEFLLAGNPEAPEYELLPPASFQPGTALGMATEIEYLTLEISIAEDLADLPWSVQASTDLDFAGGANAVQVGEATIVNGFATYLFRMPWSVEEFDGKGFLRVSLSSGE